MKINKEALRYLRSLSKLQREGDLNKINQTLTDLGKFDKYPTVCFGDVELASNKVGQYVVFKLLNPTLITSLVNCYASTNESGTFCLPKISRNFLILKGIKISELSSGFRWKLLCLKYLFFMIITSFIFVFSSKTSQNKNHGQFDLYLHKVPPNSLYSIKQYPNLKTVLSAFSQRNKLKKLAVCTTDVKKIDFDERVINTPFHFWGFSLKQKIIVLFFSFKLFASSVLDLLFGSGFLSFLSYEILMKRMAQLVDTHCIAREYAFPNSFITYYPAWMETLETRGARPILFFYSLHCLPFVKNGVRSDWHFLYSNISWPYILVWDKKFGQAIAEVWEQNPLVEISQPISLSDKDVALPEECFDVALFDVFPVRKSLLRNFGIVTLVIDDDYYVKFLNQILNAAVLSGKTIVYKSKRSSSVGLSKKVSKCLENFVSHQLVTVIESDISAHRVIENCYGVVSIPFTSTAVIAEKFQKASIYFDPSGEYKENQTATLGTPIVNNETVLVDWMNGLS